MAVPDTTQGDCSMSLREEDLATPIYVCGILLFAATISIIQ